MVPLALQYHRRLYHVIGTGLHICGLQYTTDAAKGRKTADYNVESSEEMTNTEIYRSMVRGTLDSNFLTGDVLILWLCVRNQTIARRNKEGIRAP